MTRMTYTAVTKLRLVSLIKDMCPNVEVGIIALRLWYLLNTYQWFQPFLKKIILLQVVKNGSSNFKISYSFCWQECCQICIIYICFLFRMRGNFQFVNQRISVYWYVRIQEGPELYMVDQGESNALFDMLGINI